ncbi:uncharacterized protein [Littorina saxatilis]|uniref:uncharacterized protein isoform X2 n=1 Tax=Littorina saxatilis TaxID=31220 RepID=UPI0038B62B45
MSARPEEGHVGAEGDLEEAQDPVAVGAPDLETVAVLILMMTMAIMGSVKYDARPETTPDVDNSSPTSKHTTTSHYKAARDNDTDDVTIPLSSNSNVHDTKAGNSDSGNKDSLPYSAEDSGYSSAGYSIGTSDEPPFSDKPFNDSYKPFNNSAKPFNDSAKPSNDSAKPSKDSDTPFNDSDKPSKDSTKPSDDCSPTYSTGTFNGLPYSAKPSNDLASSVYSSPGYSTGTSNGLPYSAKPFDDSASCVNPSPGYSTGTSNGLPYLAKPFDDSASRVYPF